MTIPVGPIERRTPAQWIEDLTWHRQIYRDAKFRWTGTDALLVATEFTYGHDTFETVGDLHTLEKYRLGLATYTLTCQRAFGAAINDTRTGLAVQGWDLIADLMRIPILDCRTSSWHATWADPYDRRQVTNPQVSRITAMCDGFLFASPLLLAWELKQLWSLYAAAENILEDTIADLVTELTGTVRDEDLARAAGMSTIVGLHDRVATQRTERGEPTDPRRTPHQIF